MKRAVKMGRSNIDWGGGGGGSGGSCEIDLTHLYITYLQVSVVALPTFGQDCKIQVLHTQSNRQIE